MFKCDMYHVEKLVTISDCAEVVSLYRQKFSPGDIIPDCKTLFTCNDMSEISHIVKYVDSDNSKIVGHIMTLPISDQTSLRIIGGDITPLQFMMLDKPYPNYIVANSLCLIQCVDVNHIDRAYPLLVNQLCWKLSEIMAQPHIIRQYTNIISYGYSSYDTKFLKQLGFQPIDCHGAYIINIEGISKLRENYIQNYYR